MHVLLGLTQMVSLSILAYNQTRLYHHMDVIVSI